MATTNCPNCGAKLSPHGKTIKCDYCNTSTGETESYISPNIPNISNSRPTPNAPVEFNYRKYFGMSLVSLIISFVFVGMGQSTDRNVMFFALTLMASIGLFIAGLLSLVYSIIKKEKG